MDGPRDDNIATQQQYDGNTVVARLIETPSPLRQEQGEGVIQPGVSFPEIAVTPQNPPSRNPRSPSCN